MGAPGRWSHFGRRLASPRPARAGVSRGRGRNFQNFPKFSKNFQNFPKHPRFFQNFPKHSRFGREPWAGSLGAGPGGPCPGGGWGLGGRYAEARSPVGHPHYRGPSEGNLTAGDRWAAQGSVHAPGSPWGPSRLPTGATQSTPGASDPHGAPKLSGGHQGSARVPGNARGGIVAPWKAPCPQALLGGNPKLYFTPTSAPMFVLQGPGA